MSSECLSNREVVSKFLLGEKITLLPKIEHEITTVEKCIERYYAKPDALDKYATDYECPADDDILKSYSLSAGNYVYAGTVRISEPSISTSRSTFRVLVANSYSGLVTDPGIITFSINITSDISILMAAPYDFSTGVSDKWDMFQCNSTSLTTYAGYCSLRQDESYLNKINFSFTYNGVAYDGKIDTLSRR